MERSLKPVSGEATRHEVETILQFVLKCSRSDLYTAAVAPQIPDEILLSINGIVSRRRTGEPLPYILGSVYFYSTEIIVTNEVLIPRSETEVLVERILQQEQNEKLFFADIGTGSGAISAVLLKERPLWHSLATDISPKALSVASRNVSERISFVCCDMIAAFSSSKRPFNFIVSNPPYISKKDISGLDKSVILFEPPEAIDGGNDGLDFYKILAGSAKNILSPGGRIYCEIGCDQGAAVRELFMSAFWKNISIFPDIAGRPRIVTASF